MKGELALRVWLRLWAQLSRLVASHALQVPRPRAALEPATVCPRQHCVDLIREQVRTAASWRQLLRSFVPGGGERVP